MSRLLKQPWLGFIYAFCFGLGSTLSAIPEKIGDLDEDGVATIFDVVELINLVKSNAKVSEELFPFVDINGDGLIGDSDISALSDIVLGRSSLSEIPLSVVRNASPGDGDGGVAVTRETIIRLTIPLSEASASSINNGDLFATFGGELIAGRVVVSSDRKTLTLFYDDPLPPSARVRVTLDGSNLTDSRGRVLDVDGDGEEGGVLEFDFDTLSLTFIPGTAVCGRVFASELTMSEGGEELVNVPLEGVTITVDGMEDTNFAVTDNFGNFRLDNAPVGRFFVHVDGRTATVGVPTGSYYPFVGKPWVSVPGEEINVGEVYLPLVQDGTLQSVSETEDTVIFAADSVINDFPEFTNVTITVPAGSLFNDDGSPGGMVGIAPVDPSRLPGPLPAELGTAALVITVQTDGATNFDTPAPICFPNLPNPETGEILPPGAKSALVSFNHDTGRWEVAGPMTVSEDGKLICTDPGVGVLAPGWHFPPPVTQGEPGETEEEEPEDKEQPEPTDEQNCNVNDEVGECACTSEDRVFLHSGEEFLERTDLSIPGRAGMDFKMVRAYRSKLNYDGPVGFGWTFNYDEGLFVEENGDITRSDPSAHLDRWVLQPDGSYQAPNGHFRDLKRLDDGTYLLRDSNGFKRFYDEGGRLFCHQDRFDNIMLFDYDSKGNLSTVIDVYGREIDFEFQQFPDGEYRLVSIRDFTDREVRYTYDANGDLVSVRSPVIIGTSTGNDFPLGRTERYTYSSGFEEPDLNHNLLSCTMPQEVATGGPPAMQWVYGNDPGDPMTFDRVLSETIGGTNASEVAGGGTRTFTYEKLNEEEPMDQPDLPRGKATITERNGNVMEYFVNERNHHIITRQLTRGFREGEPDYYETRSYFDEDGLMLRRVYPEGNEMQYVHDTDGPRHMAGNIIEMRQVADVDRGGGEDLVTSYTFEPLFNRMASTTDPRGNSPSYTPPLGDTSQERYTTRYFFDYQESNDSVEIADLFDIDLSIVDRGLGDLNGDGRTDQVFGNLVRGQSPSVFPNVS